MSYCVTPPCPQPSLRPPALAGRDAVVPGHVGLLLLLPETLFPGVCETAPHLLQVPARPLRPCLMTCHVPRSVFSAESPTLDQCLPWSGSLTNPGELGNFQVNFLACLFSVPNCSSEWESSHS